MLDFQQPNPAVADPPVDDLADDLLPVRAQEFAEMRKMGLDIGETAVFIPKQRMKRLPAVWFSVSKQGQHAALRRRELLGRH